jgi:HK97 family phage prohead protease
MTKNREVRYQAARELRVQTSSDGSRSISGTIFYNVASEDLGGFTEYLAPGVFSDSLAGDILCLRDHDPRLLMGRTKAKTLTLTDSADALRFVCKLPPTSEAESLAASIDRGDLSSTSFGFRTIEDVWTSDGEGNIIRTLLKVELFEVSPCSFPAYPSSSVSVRSCPASLKAKLKRSVRSNENGCDCDCESCLEGRCDACEDDGCEDEDCAENGCPNQDDGDRSKVSKSEIRKMHCRVELARRK